MGLNEVAIGIAVPVQWIKLMSSIIGQGKADKLTQYAKSVKADEALKIRLVDLVVKDYQEIMPVALKMAGDVFKLPDSGRILTKGLLRNELGAAWGSKNGLEEEAHRAWRYLTREETVKVLKAVMARLSKPKTQSKM